MSNEAKLYWLTRLDSIHTLMIVLLTISIASLFIYTVFYFSECETGDEDEFTKKWRKYKKYLIAILTISGLYLTFAPSKNDMIIIYAGGKTMDFIQADTSINKLPAKSTELIFKYLDEKVKEMDKKQ